MKILNGKGKVVLLRYAEGHDSTTRREEGFLAAIKASPGIEILSANQYGGADVEGSYKRGETVLSRYKRPDGSLDVDGIFCPNESGSFAMMRVLQDNGWAGKVRFIGFDASDNLVKGLRNGHLEALVVQDPVRMGYLSVKTMVQHLRKEKVERRIDTGVHLVTRDRMDEPEMKNLLSPDLSKWLTTGTRSDAHSALRDARHPESVWCDRCSRRRRSLSRWRRGLCARWAERGGQEHVDGGALGRAPA